MRSERQDDLPALTGLRGIAALLIVVGHFWSQLRPASEAAHLSLLWPMLGMGMAIFFTLSGYVIALSYGRWNWEARPLLNLCRLLLYRFARLYPAFLLFALVILLRSPTLRDLGTPGAAANVFDHLLLLQSWFPVKYDGQMVPQDRFNVAWSLSTEWSLYLLFGVGAAMFARSRRNWTVLAGVFFVALAGLMTVLWLATAVMLPPGWSEQEWQIWLFNISPMGILLLFGIGVASHRISPILSNQAKVVASNTGAVILVALYLLLIATTPSWTYGHSIAFAMALALLMAGSSSRSLANRLLSRPGIVYVGTVSYSLYLFHLFVIPIFLVAPFAHIEPWWFANFAAAIAFAILLAAGIYHVVEVPSRRILRRAADRLLPVVWRDTPAWAGSTSHRVSE